MSFFTPIIAEDCLQDKWFRVHAVVDYINTKYQLYDAAAIDKKSLISALNKFYINMTRRGNKVEQDDDTVLMLYCHEFKDRKKVKRQSIFITTSTASIPIFRRSANASFWWIESTTLVLP